MEIDETPQEGGVVATNIHDDGLTPLPQALQAGTARGIGHIQNVRNENGGSFTINQSTTQRNITYNYISGPATASEPLSNQASGLVLSDSSTAIESSIPKQEEPNIQIKLHHADLAVELKRIITANQLESLVLFLKEIFVDEEMNGICSFEDMWSELKRRGEISPGKYCILERALHSINATSQLQIIKEFQEKMHSEDGRYERWIRDENAVRCIEDLEILKEDYRRLLDNGRAGVVFKNAAISKIGVEGGELRLTNGSVKLEVPPGAVDREILFWMFVGQDGSPQFMMKSANGQVTNSDGIVKYSIPAHLGPSDVDFKCPVRLTMKDFSKPSENGSPKSMSVYRKVNGEIDWKPTGSCFYDSESINRLTASVSLNQFSSYILGMPVLSDPYPLNVRVAVQNRLAKVDDCVMENGLHVFFTINDYSFSKELVLYNWVKVESVTCLYLDPKSDVSVTWMRRYSVEKSGNHCKKEVLYQQHIQNLAEMPISLPMIPQDGSIPADMADADHDDVLILEQNGTILVELPFTTGARTVRTPSAEPSTDSQEQNNKVYEHLTSPTIEGKANEVETKDQDARKKKEGRKEGLVLRRYQTTLAQAGIEGKNVIITAPMGSGKPCVAAAIMKAHLEKSPKKNKVVFLVCDAVLAYQQCRLFKTFLSEFKSIELSHEIDDAPKINVLLGEYNIIVMTAQLLVNAMNPNTTELSYGMDEVAFDDFSMIVFDECQHTSASGHPYNILMGKYVDQKLAGKKHLPQVVGLTASIGVGKAKTTALAIKHILTMCANLDAQELCYPDKEMQKEIEALIYKTNETSKNPDAFLDLVSETMSKIEKRLIDACEGRSKAVRINADSIPADKGGQAYIQWISRLLMLIETSTKLPDLYRQRALKYLQHLKIYNKGLLINQECRTKDALEYLRQQFRRVNIVKIRDVHLDDVSDMSAATEMSDADDEGVAGDVDADDESVACDVDGDCDADDDDDEGVAADDDYDDDDDDDYDDDAEGYNDDGYDDEEVEDEEKVAAKDPEQKWLEQQFRDQEPIFLRISLDPRNKNQMLVKLKEIILDKYRDARSKAEARGIIFVETREMTFALCRWIRDDEDLKALNPYPLVGATYKTKRRQLNILKLFKEELHKIIVATSVAKKGLDISTCNWVIRYKTIAEETAMVQIRGRARAENSTYEVLTGGTLGLKKAQKENLNKIREIMMTRAMKEISSWRKEKFKNFIDKYQAEASDERKIAAALLEDKYADGELRGPVFILCKFCKANLCKAVELRKLAGTHRSVLSDEFKDRIKTVLLCGEPPKPIDDVEFIGKIFCAICDDELGVLAQYRSVQFPLLKIKSLLVKDGSGKNSSYKKWKDVPFEVTVITQAELLQKAAKLATKSKVAK